MRVTAAAVTAAAPRQAQLLSVFCSPRLRARKAEASGLRALRAGPRSLSFAPDSCTVAGMGDTLGRRCPVSACVLRAAPPAAVFPTWLLCRGTLDPGKEAGGTPPAAPRLPDAGRTGRPSPLRLRGRREREGAQSVHPSLRAAVQRRVPARPLWHFEDTCLKVFVPQTPRGLVGLPRPPSCGAHASTGGHRARPCWAVCQRRWRGAECRPSLQGSQGGTEAPASRVLCSLCLLVLYPDTLLNLLVPEVCWWRL